MGVLSTIASTSPGCGGSDVNTGKLGCQLGFGYMQHAIALKKGTVIPASTDLTLAYINGLIQAGTAVPLTNGYSSEPTIADDTMETSPLGIETLTLQGLHKYSLTFKEGEYFNKQISKLESFGNFDFILGDVNGNWLFAKNSAGDYKGFSAGQVTVKDVPATSSEARKKTVSFQLTNRVEMDTNYEIVLSELAFPISEVTGVNGVNLSFADVNGAVVPSNSDTTLKVKAVFAADNKTGIEGLTASNFAYSVDSSSETPTLVDDGNGYYTLTVVALSTSGVLSLQLYDGSENKNVVILSDVLYRSNDLSATVV